MILICFLTLNKKSYSSTFNYLYNLKVLTFNLADRAWYHHSLAVSEIGKFFEINILQIYIFFYKQIRCVCIWINFSEIPGVPTISMINIQADTETTLILLHIFTPSISSWQGDFTPVKVVSKQLSLKSFISFYNFWNIWN